MEIGFIEAADDASRLSSTAPVPSGSPGGSEGSDEESDEESGIRLVWRL